MSKKPYTPRKGNWVPNGPIREAVQQALNEGDSMSNICRRLGWMRRYSANDHHPEGSEGADVTRLKRRLGVALTIGGKDRFGKRPYIMTETVRYDIACDILSAVGRTPADYDL